MRVVEGTIATPKGFYADGLHCGLKKKKKDLGWIYSEKKASGAGVFTTNQIKAAPVILSQKVLRNQTLHAIVVNSGVANACTGTEGLKNADQMQKLVAEKLQVPVNEVAVASTGVIGELLPMSTIEQGIAQLRCENGEPKAFHEAILTTDLVTKEIVVQSEFAGKTVTMAGVAKGSGMIHPNMATMLSFITTDANISGSLLQEMLQDVTNQSYNQITVDGDTSTNDMVLIMANGCAENEEIKKESPSYVQLKKMLQFVSKKLAKDIARDGEGATKLIEVTVSGGKKESEVKMLAKKIVGSSLVKTAIFGEDPNWGRIVCAVGYGGVEIDAEKIDIWIGEERVLYQGQPVLFNAKNMKSLLAKDTILIHVLLNIGNEQGTAWGCDLTYNYVKINACYHT